MSNPNKLIDQLIEVLLAAEKTLHKAESLQAEAAIQDTEANAALHNQLKELVTLAGLAERGAEARAVANQQQLTAVGEKFAGQLQGFSEQLNAVIEASARSVTDSVAAIGTSTELLSSMPEKTAALQGEQLRELETSVVEKIAKALEKTYSNDVQKMLELTKRHSAKAEKDLEEAREVAHKYKDEIDLLNASLASSNSGMADLERLLEDANRRLEVEAQAHVAQQHELSDAKQKLEDREYHLALTQQHLADREQELAGQIGQLQSKISDMEIFLAERNSEVTALRRSFSWRLMALPRLVVEVVLVLPVRGIKKLYSTLFRGPAEVAADALTAEHKAPSCAENMDEPSALPETGTSKEAADATGAALTTIVRRDPYAAETEGSIFVEKTTDGPVDTSSLAARVIALYLPQYHQIPENDAWWGEGFTEWVKVKAAKPIYEGHKQPLLPHDDIGFYDLSDAEVMRRQADLARLYGISGFCIYFYWFAGKTLLEKPLQNLLANPDIDMPFMLCWANENWTRTWDGLSNNVLISQEHSPEDDLQFISHISQYLLDPRYIRVDGKPVIVLYRPDLLPDASATAERWRNWCRENGVGELYLVTTWSFGKHNPEDFGFDASMEFTPNNTAPDKAPEPAGGRLNDFAGDLYDWISIAERSERYQEDDFDFTLFRTVNPGWDNTARRQHTGARFVGANPKDFSRWLGNAIAEASERYADSSKRLVFVNAWNEWAEGAVLEPDAIGGYANLGSIRDALIEQKTDAANWSWFDESARKILLVAHDGHPHGAQMLLLHLAKRLSQHFKFQVEIVALGEGILLEEYARYARVHLLDASKAAEELGFRLAKDLFSSGHRACVANTTVSGEFVKALNLAGIKTLSLIHEMPGVITSFELGGHVGDIANNAWKVVFPATIVKDGFEGFTVVDDAKAVIRPQGAYKRNPFAMEESLDNCRALLRTQLSLPASQKNSPGRWIR